MDHAEERELESGPKIRLVSPAYFCASPRRPNLADKVDEVAFAVRHDIKYGADWIKLIATGGINDVMSDFTVQELSEEQMA